MIAEPITHLIEWQVMLGSVLLDLSQRHSLDECEIMPLTAAPTEHRHDLILVHPLQGNHIHLDLQTGLRGSFDAAEHLSEVTSSRDVAKAFRIAAVEAHIDATNAALEQHLGMAGEVSAVRRQCQLVKAATSILK